MLFHKRTKKIIKYVWGFFATLIALSMIIAYSGFAKLARTQNTKTTDMPPEVQAQLDAQKNDDPTSSKEKAVQDAIKNGKLKLSTSTNNTTQSTENTPPVHKLKLEI